MGKSNGKAESNAQAEFIRTCAEWLNVIGQLAQTPTEDARGWVSNFCYELSDYIGKNLPRVVAGKMPKGERLTGFCDDAWPRLARAVSMAPMPEEEATHTLEAVRSLLRAGDYHLAEANRRETAWKAKLAKSRAAREAREDQEAREGLADQEEREGQAAIRTKLDQQNSREREEREEAWRTAQEKRRLREGEARQAE